MEDEDHRSKLMNVVSALSEEEEMAKRAKRVKRGSMPPEHPSARVVKRLLCLPCLQASFEDLRRLSGGSRPPILRLHSNKAREFLSPVFRTHLSQQGV